MEEYEIPGYLRCPDRRITSHGIFGQSRDSQLPSDVSIAENLYPELWK
jgi:hypothetical protein